jgi:flagellar protein FlaG
MPINPLTPANSSLRPLPLTTSLPAPQATNSGPRIASNPQPETQPTVATGNLVQQAVEQIQQTTEKLAQNLQFSIDEDTGITVIKVLDSQTQEVIRQIPTEEAVSIARTLDQVKGLLFSDKA